MSRRIVLGLALAFLVIFVLGSLLAPFLKVPTTGGRSLSAMIGGGVATLALMLFSLFHASYALGWRHMLVFFAISAVVSWGFEQTGVATGAIYGPYHYTAALGPKLGHVPLLIPLAWFMMIYPSYIIANLLVDGRPLAARPGLGRLAWLALISGMVMTAWDLSVDPLLSGPGMQAWVWHDGGPYFGVPVRNYAGWLLTTFTIYLLYRLYERRVAPRPLAGLSVWAAGLPLVAYAVMALTDMFRANQALLVITPFTMGLPVLVAAGRLLDLRRTAAQQPAGEERANPAA